MGTLDVGSLEKRIGTNTSNSSLDTSPPSAHASHVEGKLALSEGGTLARARVNPTQALPIWVCFSPEDRDNPRNWGKGRKWYITCFVSMLNVLTCVCAGGISSGATAISSEFNTSTEIVTLDLSLYVLGFALGPLLLAPLSEYYGRNPVYIGSWGLLVIFQIPIAVAPNIVTVIFCRFLQGFFGSTPLTNTGGTVSDLWARNESGSAMAVYGVSSTFGPPLALVVSGYIVLKKRWRWLFWVYLIVFGVVWILMILTLPETRHTIILQKKTERLHKSLRAEGLKAADHITNAYADEQKGLHDVFAITLTRPFRFLFTEPITFFAAIYNGFIYGLVYLFNESFPLVFGQSGHGFNTGEQGLCFLGLCLGPILAALLYPFQERYYLNEVAKNHGRGLPEARMWMARGGACLLPISLFWFGWTSYTSIHWIVPIIASVFFGAGIYIVILSILSYVIDSYQTYSASALAGVILVRNIVGAGFPLFAKQMYTRLGYEWASSLLAFLSILLVPIPFIFFYRGKIIRMRSPWAREHFEQDEDSPH